MSEEQPSSQNLTPNDKPKPSPEDVQKRKRAAAAKRTRLEEQMKKAEETKRATQSQKAVATVENNSSSDNNKSNNNSSRMATAIVVFIGSLLGTLLGTFTSLNDLFESLDRVSELVNPPPTLCIAGSSTILEPELGMSSAWADEFSEMTGARLIIDDVGSIGGVDMAVNGDCVNLLAMSEPMPADQEQRLINAGYEIQCAAEIGYDVVAFVTDNNNELSVLLERLMGNILTGRATNWNQVNGDDQTIYIFARPDSGTTDFVLKEFGWQLGARQFPPNANYIACGSNIECLDMTLGTPGSLYWVSVAWMKTQPPQYLRLLPILRGDERPINPLTDDFILREYPDKLIRPMYMYVLNGSNTDPQARELAEEFLRYVRGVSGQEILERYYFRNHFNRPSRVDIPFPESFDPGDLEGVRNICKPDA